MQPFHNVQLEEKENYTRLSYLLIDQGTLCIRKIITDKLNEWQAEFKQLVNDHKRSIKKSHNLFENQKRLLLRNTQNDVIEKCDLTLLIHLVDLFKVLPVPLCGWRSQKEPKPNDLDPSSDVIRLRLMRNDLFHSVQCAIPQEDFEKRWAKGTEILRRLNATQSAIAKIKPRIFEVVERAYYVKVIRYQYSSDRPDAEEYVKKRITEEHLIAVPKPELSTGTKVICSKCNSQMICSVCTSGHQFSSRSGPSTGEQVKCSKCNRQYSNICSDCTSGHHSASEPELSKEDKICIECKRPIGNICSDCSSHPCNVEPEFSKEENI